MNADFVFNITSKEQFAEAALKVFNYQYQNVTVYKSFCDYLRKTPENVTSITEIPFLPISFFKQLRIIDKNRKEEILFTSSGTTGSITSKHFVANKHLYETSFLKAFKQFYGAPDNYVILALLPSYLERTGSSLVYMVDCLIKKSKHPDSGFYLHNFKELANTLKHLDKSGQKVLLIGVSFALLDLVEQYQFNLNNTIVMETGGMKGRRKELIREELHQILRKGFGVNTIHSEYGMTELLSQAYSKGNGKFSCPPWMKILTRDPEDPLSQTGFGKTGGINVIDLANLHSCSFIATQDLGKVYEDETFEVLGRFDNADIRGCNLMVL